MARYKEKRSGSLKVVRSGTRSENMVHSMTQRLQRIRRLLDERAFANRVSTESHHPGGNAPIWLCSYDW